MLHSIKENKGCAATVEPSSNSRGTDGNCWIRNMSYMVLCE